jgi:hypothetical protein
MRNFRKFLTALISVIHTTIMHIAMIHSSLKASNRLGEETAHITFFHGVERRISSGLLSAAVGTNLQIIGILIDLRRNLKD